MNISTLPWSIDTFAHTSQQAESQNWAYWQNRINRASLVMLAQEHLLTAEQIKQIAHAQKHAEEIQQQDGFVPFNDIMPLEKLLIEQCGETATLIHTGRSRQDIFATINQARLRLAVLDMFRSLLALRESLLKIAKEHITTWIPAYTNGVQAMPISLGFYLWAFLDSFERDSDRILEAYRRVNQSALGTGVLACSSWPLSRETLAELLGFDKPIRNGLDSSQVSLFDIPIEAANIASNIAVRISVLVQDLAQQYSQTRPWLLLDDSAAYSSSAMPQKRNPGILNKTRTRASDVIGAAQTATIRGHNLNLGMYDNKEGVSEDNSRVFVLTVEMLELMRKAFSMLKVNRQRALEELNNDWTCTMALAETLQRINGLPFRVGHNFASEIVTVARKNGYIPTTFPYETACEIFKAICVRLMNEEVELPLNEQEFRKALDPETVIRTRVGDGSPNPTSVEYGLKASEERLQKDSAWLASKDKQLADADVMLDTRFEELL